MFIGRESWSKVWADLDLKNKQVEVPEEPDSIVRQMIVNRRFIRSLYHKRDVYEICPILNGWELTH